MATPLLGRAAGNTAATGARPARTAAHTTAHHKESWRDRYRAGLRVSDTLSVATAVATAELLRFGVEGSRITVKFLPGIPSALFSCALATAWLVFLSLGRTRSPGIIAVSAEEYQRIVRVSLQLFGTLAILSLVFQITLSRFYLLIALPLGTALLLLTRHVSRVRLTRLRANGHCTSRVLVVGSVKSAVRLADTFAKHPAAAHQVVGVYVPGFSGSHSTTITSCGKEIPVIGSGQPLPDVVRAVNATTVAATSTHRLGPDRLREIAWQLKDTETEFVVDAGFTDIAVPRFTIRPVGPLPLLHVGEPQYERALQLHKRVFDILGASVALAALAPVMLLIAAAVKFTSSGPVFYTAPRVGRDGRDFRMVKFRSMVVDADQQVARLLAANDGAGPLFKMKADPRVTPVGRFIRRYSLDELPQLFNVLLGQMSLVGPRPPLRREYDTYTSTVHNRMRVRPGMTGLWQVSGRSDLPWEVAVQLDLSYVENWSFMQDIVILWRTAKAVVSSSGAY